MAQIRRLRPRPRPPWRTELNTPQIGSMAEDLLGVALAAATGGAGTVGRPRIDKGIDFYVRRLQTMSVLPVQVKASLVVGPDGAATHFVPVDDLGMLSNGLVAFVHIPAPHDQLYQRIFLVPDQEFRRRCAIVLHHGVRCYKFTAQFAGEVDGDWKAFAIELDQLQERIATMPGWGKQIAPVPIGPAAAITRGETHDVGALGSLWAEAELERAALGRLVLVEDRTRLDTVTFLIHDLTTQRFAGIHLRTAVVTRAGTIHFEVKRPHFFVDPNLWVVVVFLRRDLRVQDELVLVIPSADIRELGFSETMTLDPLTRRFRKYQIPAQDFGKVFMVRAFGEASTRARLGDRLAFEKAS